jgi:hypothetical protein
MLFWLTYKRKSRLTGVVIMEASSLISARLKAAVQGIDGGAEFVEGHELDRASAKQIPKTSIGRLLSADEAHKLIDRMEGGK